MKDTETTEDVSSLPPAADANTLPRFNRRGLIMLIAGAVVGLAAGFIARELLDGQWVVFMGLLLAFFGTVLGIGTSNDYSPTSKNGKPVKPYALGTKHLWAALGMVGLTFTFATALPADQKVDPLTCYIAGDQSVDTQTVTLQCGGDEAATIDLSQANPAVELHQELADMVVTGGTVGTSQGGASIVRIFTTGNDRTCIYYRNMADSPELTSKTCTNLSTP